MQKYWRSFFKKPTVNPIEAGRIRERATLMLARTRALTDLQGACAPAYRAMLEKMISDLDRRIEAIKVE